MIPPALVRWVREATPTVGGRSAVTVGALAVALLALYAAARGGSYLRERFGELVARTAYLASVAVSAAALWTVTVVWRYDDDVATALGGYGARQVVLLVLTLAMLLGAYAATRMIRRLVTRMAKNRNAISSHEEEIAYRVLQVGVYVVAVLVVFSLWGLDLGNLLLGAGVLGVVIGLAARQTLGSVLAGFVVLLERPFEIGDWVQIGDNEGIVTDITIVNTRLQTFDGEYVMLPNDMVSSNEVINRSRKGRLRLTVDVGVDYGTDVEHAVEVVEETLRDLDEILSVPQPQVVVKSFDDSAVVLGLRFWIDKPSARRKWRARTAVVTSVKAAFEEAGVKIPFPQRELSGRAETGGFRVADGREREAEAGTEQESESEEEAEETPAEAEVDVDD